MTELKYVTERLVFTKSTDGWSMEGVIFEPKRMRPKPPLVIWVHGIHLKFCEPEYVEIGRLVASQGMSFLSVNTRGHDFGVWLRGDEGMKLAGAGWELMHECVHDLNGWLSFAQQHGYSRIVLAGHGFGGSKIAYYMSEHLEQRIGGIVLASCASIIRDTMTDELHDKAQSMVKSGQGLDLLPWGSRPGVMPSTVSAQVQVARARVRKDLYGNSDSPPALTSIKVPVFAWFGALEQNSERDVEGFLRSTAQNLTGSSSVETALLPNATYLYTGAEIEVATALSAWVSRVFVTQ